ncbi:MAG: type II toxin-antitoxin system VapC family toxin [Armatimonadota bacterium]
MIPCVVDASVGIKLFLHEEDSERVADLFAFQLQNPEERLIAVPSFFFVECASILRKAVLAGKYDAVQACSDLADLAQMGLDITSTAEITGTAFDISQVYGATVYDACYVALADKLGIPLLTADQRLINCLAGSKYLLMNVEMYFTASLT